MNVVFGADHVLDVHLTNDLKIRRITVVDADRWLSPAAAMGRGQAYRIVRDRAKDVLCIEFRPGASKNSSLAGDAFVVNGVEILRCLFGTSDELECIAIWHMSERIHLQAG
jgi:hypothetical protein